MSTGTAATLHRNGAYWRLAVKFAARLIAADGRIALSKLRGVARGAGFEGRMPVRPDGTNRGSREGVATYRVLRALEQLGLGRRTGDGEFEATVPLAEVAAWLADEMEAAHEGDPSEPPKSI